MHNKALTTKELIEIFTSYKENHLRCPYCLNILSGSDENTFQCTNEMCLNQEEYNKEGMQRINHVQP